ncbi:SPX domain-containing protein [Helicostylum pulchrum]|uniref:SPX domain-containing protein n=1 Tax=Helicostylum pulchrum TaxID=562976 RepID=A0ABP9XXG1_9FUNG|nr:SPX domain-containing protein [Helicostylum pulchrum]
MKFAKQLETESEEIPSEWRPYLIQYKALKKLITKVAEEIESRGLSTSLLHEVLDEEAAEDDDCVPRIRYYFTGEPPNVKPNIEFTYDSEEPKVQKVLSKLMSLQSTQEIERPKLEFRKSVNNTDFFSLSSAPLSPPLSVVSEDQVITSPGIRTQRKNSTVTLVKELLNLTLEERDRVKDTEPIVQEIQPQKHLKTLVIELEQDDEFFKMLLEELNQAALLQDVTSQKFKHDISDLESRMTKVASPTQKSDMYNWRQIFSLYMDAQIFQGHAESDREFRTVERARQQMEWFIEQLEKSNILTKLKTPESKSAFKQFIALNTELITMKHYQMLNQTAMRKILKKHDKRSGLTASQSFPEIVSTNHLFSPELAHMLYSTITNKLTTIIPQPEDYACPVCMSVAWRPIRLSCNHVFCVRCLIKAQKKGMNSCPLCRHPTAVRTATALNLDEGLQNFLKMYFPQEIKDKKRDNEREQAIEDVQAMTGKKYTEEQLMRMNQPSDSKCTIM